jgi:outer membrane protein assembly factor BamB
MGIPLTSAALVSATPAEITRMPMLRFTCLVLVYGSLASAAFAADRHGDASNWPAWRGPLATGVAPTADPPLAWNEADGTNIRWKTEIPGRGHSTPIIWNNRIFLTTAIHVGDALPPRPSTAPGNHDNLPVTHLHRFVVLAVDRTSGKILWQKTLREAVPHEQGHYTGSLASNSPVTDGEFVYAFFGSFGLYCLDVDGQLVWKRDFGPMQSLHGHGEGSSPVLYGETLIVNWDHEGQSFIVALDKRTGKERWRVERDEVTSWASPIIVEHDGKPQVIVSGTSRVRGYDLANGNVLWECGGLSSNIVASPVSADGMVFAGSSYDKRALLAIRLDGANGDITSTDRVAWRRIRGTPYVPSPLLYDGGLYFLTHYQGILSRVDARTGQDQPGAFRLDGIKNIYSSPVAASGRIYVTDLDGTTLVIKSGASPQRLALNRLSEPINASAAIAGRQLFLRGEKHLYCLEEK